MKSVMRTADNRLLRPLTSALPENWSADSASVFLPEGFEKNYAYPLIVCLSQRQSGSRGLQQFHEQMTAISDRNYIGMHMAITLSDEVSLAERSAQIASAVRTVAGYANLHSERIYLLGQGKLADLALELTLANPLRYAGFLAIQPEFSQLPCLLTNFRHLNHLRGLIVAADPSKQRELRKSAQLLHNAGLEISYQTTTADSALTSPQLINRFVMQQILHNHLCRH